MAKPSPRITLAEYAAQNQTRAGSTCQVALLPDEIRSEVEEAPFPGIMHSTISKYLKSLGHTISEYPIARHRKKECRCRG